MSTGADSGPDEGLAAIQRRVVQLEARVHDLEARLRADSSQTTRDNVVPAPHAASLDSVTTPAFTLPPKPSLEARIGSQVFNRAGIIAVLVGVAWFLKYAVDREWLGAPARVLTGVAAGFALIVWSERFRRRGFPVFSFSLKAVGTGILYLSLWAASALFGLVPYEVALLGMALITAGNAWLCLAQRSQVLAAYALTGGFLSPALLGLGHATPLALGGYLVLLNAGLFALLRLRSWPRLLPAAFAGTIAYVLWLAFRAAAPPGVDVGVSLAIAGFFFVLFSLAAVYLVSPEQEAQRLGAVTAVANALAGGLALWLLLGALAPRPSPWQARTGLLEALWFAALLAAGRLRRPAFRLLAEVHAALVIGMAAAGMWLALGRAGLIAGLVAETAVLLTLSLRRAQGPAGAVLASPLAPVVLMACAVFALVLEAALHLLPIAERAFLNVRFALFAAGAAVAIYGVRVAARQHGQTDAAAWARAGRLFALVTTTLLLLAGVFEAQTGWGGSRSMAERVSVSGWAATLGVLLLVAGFRVRWPFLRWQGLALLTLAVGKVFLFDTRSLTQGYGIVSFLGLGVLLLGVSFIYQRDLLNLRGKEHSGD